MPSARSCGRWTWWCSACTIRRRAIRSRSWTASSGEEPRIIDASSTHRVTPGWVYGFPELAPGQPELIARADRVGNPGCYPTGAIALLRPLIDAGLIPADHPITVNAVSGYTGGGRPAIELFESGAAPSFELYGLGFEHKHLPELQLFTGLTRRPIFVPSIANFPQGMLVSIPLHLDLLPGKPKAQDLEAVLKAYYANGGNVSVVPTLDGGKAVERIEPEGLNDTDGMELRVFSNEAYRHAVLVARLDNLGKGASGRGGAEYPPDAGAGLRSVRAGLPCGRHGDPHLRMAA